jgi:hypothetical protein
VNWRVRLQIACAMVLCAMPAAVRAQHTIAEQYLFQSINAERAAVGLPMLRWNDALTNAAQYHAVRMRSAQNISHQFAGEPDLSARAADAGSKFSRVAENVATSGSVIQMHAALMNSQHHRENILDPAVTSIGISVVASGRQLWGVEDFAKDVVSMSFDEQEQQVGNQLASLGLQNISVSDEARRMCRMPTGFVGTRPAFVMRYSATDLTRLPAQLTTRLAQGGVSEAAIGACEAQSKSAFATYNIAVVLYR